MLRMTETNLGWHQVGCSKCVDGAMANDLSSNEVCVRGTWSFPLSADLIPGRRSTHGRQNSKNNVISCYSSSDDDDMTSPV